MVSITDKLAEIAEHLKENQDTDFSGVFIFQEEGRIGVGIMGEGGKLVNLLAQTMFDPTTASDFEALRELSGIAQQAVKMRDLDTDKN